MVLAHIYFLLDLPLVLDLNPLSDHNWFWFRCSICWVHLKLLLQKSMCTIYCLNFFQIAEFTAYCQIANTWTYSIEHKLNILQSHLSSWFCDRVLASQARGWVLNSQLGGGIFNLKVFFCQLPFDKRKSIRKNVFHLRKFIND